MVRKNKLSFDFGYLNTYILFFPLVHVTQAPTECSAFSPKLGHGGDNFVTNIFSKEKKIIIAFKIIILNYLFIIYSDYTPNPGCCPYICIYISVS